MKIVINALQYRPNGSGISLCLRELFGPFTCQTPRPCSVILPKNSPLFPCAKTAELVYAPCAFDEGIRRVAFQTFFLGIRYCRNAALLTVDSKLPLFLPKSCRVFPLITDLAVFRMPAAYQGNRVVLWRLQYRYLLRRAELFFAISEFTKREMTEILGVPQEKIEVIPCASGEKMHPVTDLEQLRALREKYGLPEHYILFVGNFNPRKNLERLLRAFDRMKRETGLSHMLAIAGGQGWKFNAGNALRKVEHRDAVRFIGYVPDADMPALYSAASLFVFPTLYEGFGIPVLEAQQCGVPVLTSSLSALPEVGGEGADYVDPYDEAAIARSMGALLTDRPRCEELIRKGFLNARRYSWTASARKLNEIIEGCVQ